MKMSESWINKPSKKQVVLVVTAWFIGNLLLIAANSNLFTENFFRNSGMIGTGLMIMSTVIAAKVCLSYRERNKNR